MTAALRAVLRQVHEGERELEDELHVVAERHRSDHEVRHTALDLARWSLQNRKDLAPVLERYGDGVDTEPHDPGGDVLRSAREKAAELLGRRPETGAVLLRDLRQLYLLAQGNAVLWTVLGQGAQALKDRELLLIVTQCHDRSNRQATWCLAQIKVTSPQALSAV